MFPRRGKDLTVPAIIFMDFLWEPKKGGEKRGQGRGFTNRQD